MIVALLTDFGTRDHYVGTMKAVVLSVCPEATLVDITHEIAPQDVRTGALELLAAYRYFPAGTVFLVVIDPGVGSARRAIAADAGGYRFVGPDNGVFSPVFAELARVQVVELHERRFTRPIISRTFEGRDRFAPVAGWLARGTDLAAFGPSVSDPAVLVLPVATVTGAGVTGEVLRIDRFGNLITNIDARLLADIAVPVVIEVGGRRIPLVQTYADAQPLALCALVGSSGFLEIAVNGGSAADTLNAAHGEQVLVQGPAIRREGPAN